MGFPIVTAVQLQTATIKSQGDEEKMKTPSAPKKII